MYEVKVMYGTDTISKAMTEKEPDIKEHSSNYLIVTCDGVKSWYPVGVFVGVKKIAQEGETE